MPGTAARLSQARSVRPPEHWKLASGPKSLCTIKCTGVVVCCLLQWIMVKIASWFFRVHARFIIRRWLCVPRIDALFLTVSLVFINIFSFFSHMFTDAIDFFQSFKDGTYEGAVKADIHVARACEYYKYTKKAQLSLPARDVLGNKYVVLFWIVFHRPIAKYCVACCYDLKGFIWLEHGKGTSGRTIIILRNYIMNMATNKLKFVDLCQYTLSKKANWM